MWKGFGNIGEFRSGDNVTAYYPYSSNANNLNAIEVVGGVDFMICPKTPLTITGSKASANLKFEHALSKLVATMAMPEEIAGVKTVSLESITVKNVFRKGTINLADGKFSSLADKGDVVLNSGTAIIIPQTISRIEFVFKMKDGTSMMQAHVKDLALTSGKQTTLTAISNADLYFTSTLDLKNGEAQTNLPLSFYVAPGRQWTLTSSEPWLTFAPTTGTGSATVKVNVTQNAGVPRTATITLTDDKQASTAQKPMQNYVRTVTIAGTKWTTRNLTGVTQGQTTGFTLCANPQDYGMFWKWGSLFMYNRISGDIPSGHWGEVTTWAATAPIEQTQGYDYGSSSLASSFGAPVGDPCQSLGANYKTPTYEQIMALYDTGHSACVSYKGVKGFFFGHSASSCSDLNLISSCLFLPCAGLRYWSNGLVDYEIICGRYWSSSVFDANQGWNLYLDSDGTIYANDHYYRGEARSVRCVAE